MTVQPDRQLPLRGRTVALVEDEALVAMYVEEMLFDLGADAVRMASNVETAMALLDSGMPQFAVLDLNLSGHASYPIARRLDAAAVPYIFLTGYGAEGVDPVWRTRAILQKPATLDLLRQAVCSLLA